MMCLAACDLSLASSSVEAEACKPIWEDDFQEDLDTANWNVIEGDGCALGLCGWGNRELQTYDARAVSVANGPIRSHVHCKKLEFDSARAKRTDSRPRSLSKAKV